MNINEFLTKHKKHPNPVTIQLGNTGDGNRPNYQVEFEDGSIKTFRFSGKEHSASKFNPSNLDKKQLWEKFRTLT